MSGFFPTPVSGFQSEFESSVPTRAQLAAWEASARDLGQSLQAQAEERDRGLDAAMQGRRMRRPEPLESDR